MLARKSQSDVRNESRGRASLFPFERKKSIFPRRNQNSNLSRQNSKSYFITIEDIDLSQFMTEKIFEIFTHVYHQGV